MRIRDNNLAYLRQPALRVARCMQPHACQCRNYPRGSRKTQTAGF